MRARLPGSRVKEDSESQAYAGSMPDLTHIVKGALRAQRVQGALGPPSPNRRRLQNDSARFPQLLISNRGLDQCRIAQLTETVRNL